MARIGREGTGPEREAAAILEGAGVTFRRNAKGLPGTPDLAVDGRRVAVFVDGCFWHGCPVCGRKMPKSNAAYWEAKFRANAERDAAADAKLRVMGWTPFRVRGCDVAGGMADVLRFLGERADG